MVAVPPGAERRKDREDLPEGGVTDPPVVLGGNPVDLLSEDLRGEGAACSGTNSFRGLLSIPLPLGTYASSLLGFRPASSRSPRAIDGRFVFGPAALPVIDPGSTWYTIGGKIEGKGRR